MNSATHPTPPKRRNIAILIGNGLSIAYDPALRLDAINRRIMDRISRDIGTDGTTASKALVEVARGIHSGDPATDFESLIGALEQYAISLRTLEPLAGIAGPHDRTVAGALRTSSDFIDLLRNAGLGHVLEVIADASRVDHEALSGVQEFIDAVVRQVGWGRLTVGNLNYDALAMAALLSGHDGDVCDMADPRREDYFEISHGGPMLRGFPLRTKADYPARRIRLVHLHGSLTWLRRRSDGLVVRFQIGDLRNHRYWAHLRDGTTDWHPEVVLTNQAFKSAAVSREPYTLAYNTFGEGLATSDFWLIVGYSFRDACVNDLLRLRFEARASAGLLPKVLVVTRGTAPTTGEILNALGQVPWEKAPWLSVYRGGVETLTSSGAWTAWLTSGAVLTGAA